MYKNLKIEMLKANISQKEIAAFLKVHENTIGNKISGNGNFSIEEVFKIKERYFPNHELEYLFKKTIKNAKSSVGQSSSNELRERRWEGMEEKEKIIEALTNWILRVTDKKEMATPGEVAVLPEIAKTLLYYLLSSLVLPSPIKKL